MKNSIALDPAAARRACEIIEREIMNDMQMQTVVDPFLPPGTLELRYGRKVVGRMVNIGGGKAGV